MRYATLKIFPKSHAAPFQSKYKQISYNIYLWSHVIDHSMYVIWMTQIKYTLYTQISGAYVFASFNRTYHTEVMGVEMAILRSFSRFITE
jgi:hypothetical protein